MSMGASRSKAKVAGSMLVANPVKHHASPLLVSPRLAEILSAFPSSKVQFSSRVAPIPLKEMEAASDNKVCSADSKSSCGFIRDGYVCPVHTKHYALHEHTAKSGLPCICPTCLGCMHLSHCNEQLCCAQCPYIYMRYS